MDSLGKGLESLIPKKDDAASSSSAENQELSARQNLVAASARGEDDVLRSERDSVFWIEVEKIKPNPYQPRREFNPEALADLAQSIRQHGVIQPILVSRIEKETQRGLEVSYELIAGERRLRAAELAGLRLIPAVIRRAEPDNRLKLEIALIENIQREDLNIIEKARAYKQLVDEFHMVQREIAEKIGKSREVVANTIRLLNLPEDIQQGLIDGKIGEGHARAILMVGSDPEMQRALYTDIVTAGISSRDAEVRAREVIGRPVRQKAVRKSSIIAADPELRLAQSRLEETLGTRVVLQKSGARGRIVVEFFSEEELQNILGKIIREA